jgi:ABC-type molybdate transport system ATPase subunit
LRIDPKDLDIKTTTQKERSLRFILEKKLKNISKNEQEKTISLLTAGP